MLKINEGTIVLLPSVSKLYLINSKYALQFKIETETFLSVRTNFVK